MDFLTALNLDGFYAHKKPWHPSLWFLTPSRMSQMNTLIQKINFTLNQPPSVAHQSLFNRYSSAYFWQSMETQENFAQAKEVWQNIHLVIYVEAETLVWFIDHTFPLLEEYLSCALKETDALRKNAQESSWQHYLPGYTVYLNGVTHLREHLTTLTLKLNALKKQTSLASKLKIEQNNDLLKLIARILKVPCDFESLEQINVNTLMFLKQTHPDSDLTLPKIQLDKNPPLISPVESKSRWQALTQRLRDLKLTHRLKAPKLNTQSNLWPVKLTQYNWPNLNQAKLYFLQKSLKYLTLPILAGLFFNGWLALSSLAMGITLWASYPYLTKFFSHILAQSKKIDTILQSYTEAYFRDFLVERCEYIETIERSALWRKNRLSVGCHHLNSLEPNLLLHSYEEFKAMLQQKIKDLSAVRPSSWQIWRQETVELIDMLVTELNQEQSQLTLYMQLYAVDIAHRINQSFFLEKTYSLDKITDFVAHFSPEAIPLLNQENQAIDYFLACLCENSDAALLLRRPLVEPRYLATHCCDVVAINHIVAQITPQIKHANKLQALLDLVKLLKQASMISVEQLENHLAQIATPSYSAEIIKQNLQQYLFSTFNGQQIAIKTFFSSVQHQNLSAWLKTKQALLNEAEAYFLLFLKLPDHQDWGVLPASFVILSPEQLKQNLTLLAFNGNHAMAEQLRDKIVTLAPSYTGNPSEIFQWLPILWPENLPETLEERIIEARFAWTLDKISTDNNLDSLKTFMQEVTEVLPRADHDHRLSRALVNHPNFYLPWHVYTQKAVVQLEENGLMLPAAKAAYSQKGLQQWLRLI